MKRIVYLLPLLLSLSGCQLLQLTPDAYVEADRATYDAVAAEYSGYVANDPALTQEQKDRRDRTVETWRLRLKNTGQVFDEPAPAPETPPVQ